MMKLSNDQKTFVQIECADLYGNATNKPMLQKNLWMMECLNVVSSCGMALDSNIRVMTFKDGGGNYEKAIPQEVILDGKQPWVAKAMQTIPGFPYYWGNRHVARDKTGATWYGGFCQWPSCFAWVPEEKTAYCYWGEENTINLSTAHIIPEFCCASLSTDTSTVDPGNKVRVTASLWNFGDADGDDTINVESDGAAINTTVIHLAANTDSIITFTLSALSAGAHVVSIDSCRAGLFVTGSSAVAKPFEIVHPAPRAQNRFMVRLFDLQGKNVRTVESDRSDPNNPLLTQGCARGLYLVEVYDGVKLTRSKIILK